MKKLLFSIAFIMNITCFTSKPHATTEPPKDNDTKPKTTIIKK